MLNVLDRRGLGLGLCVVSMWNRVGGIRSTENEGFELFDEHDLVAFGHSVSGGLRLGGCNRGVRVAGRHGGRDDEGEGDGW
jgi:hypothetical protein